MVISTILRNHIHTHFFLLRGPAVLAARRELSPEMEDALVTIVGQEGGKDREAAVDYLEGLRASKRYQRDVY